ncbi:MAG: four-helix bundle copper-binding protein [Candidatus Obscuribacterales bacterium]|nr:four-helix bundle copper-binding protein [Candidatus Obscuribacterales bacterium]
MKGIFATILSIMCSLFIGLGAFAQTTEQITKGNCSACADMCQKTLNYCVQKKGRHGEQTVTNALKDCITACKTAGEFLSRGSRFEAKASAMCIEACTLCVQSCQAFSDDNNMKACAEECRKCAANCQKIVAQNGKSI